MESIYLIALEIIIIIGMFNFLSLSLSIILSLILVVTIYIFQNKKNIFLIILPLIFLARIFYISSDDFKIGDIRNFTISYYEGKGRILKIDKSFSKFNSYTVISNCNEGKYKVVAKIENIIEKYNNRYYNLDIIKLEPVSDTKIEKYFQNKSDDFLKYFDYDFKRVYKAVILGEKYRLTREMKEKFSYIGISHLMALSGFHIALVISLISFLLPKTLPLKKRGRNIVLLIFLSLYYIGIEHSPSLDRAYIMGVIYLLGKIFNENTELFKTLTVSYVLSLIYNPNSIFDISFQLSYGALFIIAEIFPIVKTKLYKGKSKFMDGIILTLTIQVIFIPFLMKEFGVIQIFSFLSNIIVLPIGTIFISLSFIGLLLENIKLGFLIVPLLKGISKIFFFLVDLFYSFPLMSIKYRNESFFISIFYFIIILIALILKFRKDYRTDEKIYKRTKISQ